MTDKWKCILGHEHYRPEGGFRIYEEGRVYNESELPANPGLPYWEPVEAPVVPKKKTGGNK